MMKNPAALYIEGFRSVPLIMKHMDALSDEQKKVLAYYDEIEQAPPITRDEADEFVKEIEKTVFELFEGANEVFKITPCGQYRLGEEQLKDIDILITRNDEGATRYLLLKLVEKLEEKGIIIQ
jgi:hypothetical protein